MKLAGQSVTLMVNDAGRELLARAGLGLPYANLILVSVEESEDLGLWLKVSGTEEDHLFLLMWHYIEAIDAPTGTSRLIGLRGGKPISL